MSRTIVRRIPLASLIVASTLLVAGALGGWATAASSEAAQPEEFQLAGRHGGDQGTWHVNTVVEGGAEEATLEAVDQASMGGMEATDMQRGSASFEGSASNSTIVFEWLPEEAWHDGEGVWHAVHGLLAVDPDAGLTTNVNGRESFTPAWDLLRFETASGALVGATGLAGGGASTSSGLLGGEEITTVVTATRWDPTAYNGDVACGLGDALRLGVDLADPITVDGCGPTSATFLADGVDTIEGVQAVRFTADVANESLTYWFNPGLPEAVRIVREGSHADGTVYRTQRDLVSFEPGTDAWDTGITVPSPASLPAIDLAPRQPWGPDDSGLEHPFPLSDAWKRASEDPTFTDFGDFLAAHPDAAAVDVEYMEETDGTTEIRTWDLLVTADGGAFSLTATQTQVAGLAAVLGGPASAVANHEFSGSEPAISGFPDPEDLPAEVPTAASTVAYFDALYGDEVANAYGLATCWQPGCDLAVSAGIIRRDQPRAAPGQPAEEPTFTSTTLSFTEDGQAFEMLQVDEDFTRRAGLLDPPASMAEGSAVSDHEVGPTILRGALTPWALPVSTATGVTVTAVVLGALALLWPILKGLPVFGLFSRVQTDRLLDHSVRSRIVMAVEAQPGIHYQGLLREAGTGKGALEHHLRKLEAAGILTAVRSGRYTCYFPEGTRGNLRATAPALKSDGARRILETVQARPGISGQGLVEATGLSPSTVSTHVARLTQVGLLQGARSGRSLHLHAAALANEAQQFA